MEYYDIIRNPYGMSAFFLRSIWDDQFREDCLQKHAHQIAAVEHWITRNPFVLFSDSIQYDLGQDRWGNDIHFYIG